MWSSVHPLPAPEPNPNPNPNPNPSSTPNQVHPLPALEPMFQSEALAALLRGYLGGPVRYDGHF